MIPIKRNVTGRGVAIGCAGLAMLVVGLLLGNGELITLGACCLLLVGGCFVLAPVNLRGLELSVDLPPRFHARRTVGAELQLLNRRKVLDAWGVEIRVRFPHAVELSGHAAWTSAQGRCVLSQPLSIPDRAEFSELACEFLSRFPLGLFEVRMATVSCCPALVYPRLITPVELQWDGLQADHLATMGTGVGDLLGEPRGIRPYQPGDKAARIHQFASARSIARGQGLQVRAFDPPGYHPAACRIVFHSAAKAGAIIRSDRFERALSLAAGTLAHLQAHQTKVSFQADFADWRCRPCENRAQSIECLVSLTQAKRADQAKAHELAEILRKTPAHEQLIIISDSPPDLWADLVPASHPQAILVDIRQVRFKGREIHLQPVHKP